MKIFGDKLYFAIELGDFWEGSKQHQDIKTWLNGKHITDIDSVVYLPSYHTSLNKEINKLQNGIFFSKNFLDKSNKELFKLIHDRESFDQYKVLCYDLTVYPANCYFVNTGKSEKILYSFWDERHEPTSEINQVFSVNISKSLFVSTLKEVLNNISTVWY